MRIASKHIFPHDYGGLKTISGLARKKKWKILVRHPQYTDWHVLGNKMDEKCLPPGGSAIVWFCSKIWIEYHRIFALVSTAMKTNTVCILVKSKKCFKTLKLRLISTNELLFHQCKWSLRFVLFTKVPNGGSERNNLKLLKVSLLNSCSFVKKYIFNHKILLRVEFLKFTCP